MVQLTRIYTKGGDKGTTSLGSGKRVPKHDLRVSAYGTVDEANAAIGVARLHLTQGADENLSAMLARIQNDLFDLGADLCRPEPEAGKQESSGTALRVLDSQVERLEREIDSMNARLSPLNSFVLPGGKPAAAYLHMARTIVRRAEREMTLLAERESVSPAAIRYVNRLSDHLFVAARFANDLGAKDVLWQPGATRSL
jgi:cob(I)alamin adenosyltransferase